MEAFAFSVTVSSVVHPDDLLTELQARLAMRTKRPLVLCFSDGSCLTLSDYGDFLSFWMGLAQELLDEIAKRPHAQKGSAVFGSQQKITPGEFLRLFDRSLQNHLRRIQPRRLERIGCIWAHHIATKVYFLPLFARMISPDFEQEIRRLVYEQCYLIIIHSRSLAS